MIPSQKEEFNNGIRRAFGRVLEKSLDEGWMDDDNGSAKRAMRWDRDGDIVTVWRTASHGDSRPWKKSCAVAGLKHCKYLNIVVYVNPMTTTPIAVSSVKCSEYTSKALQELWKEKKESLLIRFKWIPNLDYISSFDLCRIHILFYFLPNTEFWYWIKNST